MIGFCSIALFAACDSNTTDSTVVSTDTSMTMVPATTTETVTTTNTTYMPAEGDAIYRGGKLMVWRNGDYVLADSDVTYQNGVMVTRAGKVKLDDKTVDLKDGEVVTSTGGFFDNAGHAISDGWDATKHGVNTALKKTGDALKKAGKETKEAITGKEDPKH